MVVKISLIIAACVVIVAAQNAEKKCAKDGEYCQNHWDCCSNSCLSFLYKCVKTNNPDNTAPTTAGSVSLGNRIDTDEPSMTLDQLLNNLFGPNRRPQNWLTNRFEGEQSANPQKPETAGVPECKVNGSKCLNSNECCTNLCHGYLHQCVT